MRLRTQLGVLDILVYDAHRNDHPQRLVLRRHKLRLKRAVIDVLIHHVFSNVKATIGDIVITAALTRVEVEELKRTIALVVLDVEVGEARKLKVLKQLAHATH